MGVTETTEPTREQTRKHAALVAGLRAAADWFEQNPDYTPTYSPTQFDIFVADKARLAAAVPVLGKAEKSIGGSWFSLRRRFSENVYLDVNAPRDKVCRKVVTGVEQVPAQLVEAYEREIVEWICDEPLLASV